jgi:hypothetical protein
MIAALFVQKNGCYFGLDGVDPWDEDRDARTYPGPYPVVAHPPCSRWCKLAALVEARWGHKRGEDDGCFEAALKAVRTWGGILEHPAYSRAWNKFGLIEPHPNGGWIRDLWGGAACHVEQGNYGHPARKATWLYAFGTELPTLKWGGSDAKALVSWCANKTDFLRERQRVGKAQAAKTPAEFRDILIQIAQSAT